MTETMKNIPKLRFPEFQNAPEWEEKPLGAICDYWNGGSHEGGVSDDGEYFLISLNSLDIEGNLKTDMKKVDYLDGSLEKNDLVMVLSDVAHGNFLGLTAIIPNSNYVLNQRMAGLRRKANEKVAIEFLRLYINHNQKYFKQHGQGSSQLNLSKSSVTDFPVLFPLSENEQQKIADCLSSLDELIASQAEKVEALKTHKKALMQQLFPREGESIPRLRFPEFQNAPEWEEKNLAQIIDFKSGYAFSSSSMSNEVQQYQLIKMSNVYQNTLALDRNPSYWHELNKAESEFLLNKGDVVLTLTGTVGKKDYGYSVMIEEDDKFLLNQRLVRLRAINGVSVSEFIKYLALNEMFLDSFFTNSRGGTGNQSNVSVEDLKRIKLPLPLKEEQQKIGFCLSSIDELITSQTAKVEALKEHKKALMQQLFPSVNKEPNK